MHTKRPERNTVGLVPAVWSAVRRWIQRTMRQSGPEQREGQIVLYIGIARNTGEMFRMLMQHR
jgi:hypothetical protein